MCYSWDLGLLLLFCRMQSSRTAPVNIFKKYGLWPSHTQHALNIKFIRFLSIKIRHFAFFSCFLHFWPLFFPPFLYLSREVGINFHPGFLSQTSHALKDKFTLWESEEAGDYWSWLPCFLFSDSVDPLEFYITTILQLQFILKEFVLEKQFCHTI